MMTAAFGEESATGSSILSPSSGTAILSQDSGEALGSSEEAKLLPDAVRSPEGPLPEHTRRHEDSRYQEPPLAGGEGSGTPAVSWSNPQRGMTGEETAADSSFLGDHSTPPSGLPMAAGFSMRGAGNGGTGRDYEPLPAARREWSLTTTNPSNKSPNGNEHLMSLAEASMGAGGAGGAGDGGWGGAGIMPPRWVPDEETAACAGCGKDFDWARRRHHCRACGRLYCYSCSRFRALLPRSFGTRDPQRVCQPCNARVAPLQEMLAGSVSNAVKENDVSQGGLASYLNRPIVFTLGAEVRKAAYTIHNFTKEGMIQDRSIPQELLGRAKGLAFLTVIKGGFIVAGRVGTGLVLAKTEDGIWSAPSAIATVGMGWGALIGGEITDFVLVLNTDSAVEAFSGRGQVSIGAELSVAVGPLGRTGAGNLSVAAEGLAHAYSYSHSRGLFAGLSLEGGVIMARPDVNRKFYGREISVRDLLSGSVAPPPAARPLYEALEQRGGSGDNQPLLSQGFRMG